MRCWCQQGLVAAVAFLFFCKVNTGADETWCWPCAGHDFRGKDTAKKEGKKERKKAK
jgi:hypothetical protein